MSNYKLFQVFVNEFKENEVKKEHDYGLETFPQGTDCFGEDNNPEESIEGIFPYMGTLKKDRKGRRYFIPTQRVINRMLKEHWEMVTQQHAMLTTYLNKKQYASFQMFSIASALRPRFGDIFEVEGFGLVSPDETLNMMLQFKGKKLYFGAVIDYHY